MKNIIQSYWLHSVIALITVYSCNNEGTFEQRKNAAEEILSKECKTVTNIATEYIENEIISVIVGALASNRCGCVNEVLISKMAEEYTINQLEELKSKPTQKLDVIRMLIQENNSEVRDCFSFKSNN